MFSWFKKFGRSKSTNKNMESEPPVFQNAAFVFVKPHANTPATQKLVREKLISCGIKIISELDIEGTTIDEKMLIDQHYYAIASKATILAAKDIPVPVGKFQESFGETWETVLKEDRAVNAMEACKRFQCTSQELDDSWREAEKAGKVVKFGGGFYCGLLERNGSKLYVFNAFFMNMRSKFVGEGVSIHCFEVEWDPKKLSWKSFRGEVLGPTDPAQAPEGSLRKKILDDYEALGLTSAPNKGDNGVHASASPFEGLAERMNWLGKAVEDDSFGKAILAAGIPKETIKEWSVDPQIQLPGGNKGSIFDALEDTDVDICLKKMKEFYELK